jgi:hypothetical protein
MILMLAAVVAVGLAECNPDAVTKGAGSVNQYSAILLMTVLCHSSFHGRCHGNTEQFLKSLIHTSSLTLCQQMVLHDII